MQQMYHSLLSKKQAGRNTPGDAFCRPAHDIPLSANSTVAPAAVKKLFFQKIAAI